jgi:phosphoserine aminotransferase
MTARIFNFSSGPAILPVPVLEKACDEMLSFRGSGMSIMEMSHRSPFFEEVLHDAATGIRGLLYVPDNYRVLFLQGGATLQFSMVPLNFLGYDRIANYIVTGAWGRKAVADAERCGSAKTIYSSEASGFRVVPQPEELRFSPDAAYVHYTSNETIDGVEFRFDIDGGGIPVVCDASSNILSKPIDVSRYSLIYAGAQKNIGPSGVTVVIISEEMLDRVPRGQHRSLDYRLFAENDSMSNTPNTWGIYIMSLVCDWLSGQGGLEAIAKKNKEKAQLLYNAIDRSDGFYIGHAETEARSTMNVTFRLGENDMEAKFCEEAAREGLDGLKGHRSVGGIRASIYNAFPLEGVKSLTAFMEDFASRNGK